MTVIEQILDLARWAPSGDNTQPWRFEIRDASTFVVHGFDTRRHCVYDLDGRPSQIALGALLETIDIAASGHGLRADISRVLDAPDEAPTFEVRCVAALDPTPSALLPFITVRTVQRRPLRTTPLTEVEKSALQASTGPGFEVLWFETPSDRWRVAKLLFRNAKVRLTMPEAFAVHRSVIEWNAQFSEDRIPDRAVGVDTLTRKLMQWVMQSWPRVEFFNTWLAGTIMPRLQLDLLPGWACAAHFGLLQTSGLRTIDDHVAAGRAVQRFWLEATRLGLLVQPEMTPVIFGRYVRDGVAFTSRAATHQIAVHVAAELEDLVDRDQVSRLAFFGRIGRGAVPASRSIRLPLSKLMWRPGTDTPSTWNDRVKTAA